MNTTNQTVKPTTVASLLAAITITATASNAADIVAAFDINSGSSPTAADFVGLTGILPPGQMAGLTVVGKVEFLTRSFFDNPLPAC